MKTDLTRSWLVCRICLQAKDKMDTIFSENAEKDLTKKILECGGVPIKQFDHYPDKICFQCNRYLQIAYKFRQTCQRSHKHLSRFIAPVVIEETDQSSFQCADTDAEETEEHFPEDSVDEHNITEDAEEVKHHDIADTNNDDLSETQPGDLFLPEDNTEAEEVSLKLEPEPDDQMNIKKEMSELDEAEIVDIYEPIEMEDVEIFEEFEEEAPERTTSALSEEVEYLEELINDEITESDEEFQPNSKVDSYEESKSPTTTIVEPSSPTTTTIGSLPQKSRGRPKGSKNSKPSTSKGGADPSGEVKEKVQSKRGRKPKNPDFTVYICDICGNTYPTQGRLTDHIKQHNGIKPHECEICGHAFSQTQQLTRHMNTHTGNRPYKCNYCPAGFADLSTRNKHHRIHTNERPYVCDVCGKAFSYTNTLKFHRMLHTGEKPFVCNICGKGFQQAYKLRNHKRTHEKRAIKAEKLELEALATYHEVNEAAAQIMEI